MVETLVVDGGGDVQTFTIGVPRSELLSRFGRNRLVRWSDRIEVLATTALGVLAIAMIPVVTTAGIAVDHHQAAMYAQQAQTVHRTEATATADSSDAVGAGDRDAYATRISWDVEGVPRVGTITSPQPLKVGDSIPIWVDVAGGLGRPPVSTDQAVTEAVVMAALLWLTVMGSATALRQLLVWGLDRRRGYQWDGELRTLVGQGGREQRRRREHTD
jgi:hypothetical protein